MHKLLFLILITATAAQTQPNTEDLRKYLANLPSSTVVNMRVESIGGAVYFEQNATVSVPAASIIKVPILVELMEQVKENRLRLSDEHALKAVEKVGGAGAIVDLPEDTKLSINELARQMIISSDNTATNILISKIGREATNSRMKQLQLPGLQLNRLMMDTLAVKQGVENYVTATEINALLRKIYQNQVATPPLCGLMMQFLEANEDTLTLPRLLPKGVKIAHKTGTLNYVRSDAGIVLGKNPFVISVFVQGTTTAEAERIIGEIGAICYQNFR